MLSKNATNKVRHTAPRTYMSAAGLQSEIDPKTLAQLALHDTRYKDQLSNLRTDVERKVTDISQDQRLLHKSMIAYKKRRKNIARARKKQEKAKSLPSIASSQLPSNSATSEKSIAVSRRTSGFSSSTPLSSTRVNLSTPSNSAGMSRLTSSSTELLDSMFDLPEPPPPPPAPLHAMYLQRNESLFPEPRFLGRNDVILEESEPETDSDTDSESGHETKAVTKVSRMLTVDDTPRSNVTLSAVDVQMQHAATDSNLLTPRIANPKTKKQALDSSMSFIKLVRLKQTNSLSRNLTVVDEIAKKMQPQKLPTLPQDKQEIPDVAKILTSRNSPEKTILFGRNTQSEHTREGMRPKHQVSIRGHSDTTGFPVLTRPVKTVTPFHKYPFRDSIVPEKTISDGLPGTPAVDDMKEASLMQTKTWLHNTSLVENAELPSENTFLSDDGGGSELQTPRGGGGRGLSREPLTPGSFSKHVQRNEPMRNSAHGDPTTPRDPDSDRSLTNILGEQYRRTHSKDSMHPRSGLEHLPSRYTPHVDQDPHSRLGAMEDSKAEVSLPNQILSPRKSHHPHFQQQHHQQHHHQQQHQQHLQQQQHHHQQHKTLEENQRDMLASQIPSEAREYRTTRHDRSKKPHTEKDIRQKLKDERKAIEKEDMYNDIKWRRKLARVKEVHFLSSGDPS